LNTTLTGHTSESLTEKELSDLNRL